MTARSRKKGSRRAQAAASQPPPRPAAGIPLRRVLVPAGVAALVVIHFALAVTSTRDKCCTFDEVAHLTKGYAFWKFDDHRLMPEHPPLAHAWAALPLLNEKLTFPGREQPAWYKSKTYDLGKEFFYGLGNDPDAMLRQSRRMVAILSVALGVLVFGWSRRLFGTAGGFVSLALYTFSPTVLAHGRLVTTDLAVSLFFLASVGALWRVLHHIGPLSLLAGAAALSGLFLSKMSAVLIIPTGLALVILRLIVGAPLEIRFGSPRWLRRRWQQAIIFLAVMVLFIVAVWAVIWTVYDFRYEAMLDAQPDRDVFFSPNRVPPGKTVWEHMGRSIPATAAVVDWMRTAHILPESYVFGWLFTVQSARGRDAFLNGDRRLTGWWHFFPLCFALKVPLAVMAVVILALVAVLMGRARKPDVTEKEQGKGARSPRGIEPTLYDTAPLWMLMLVYWAVAVTSNLNIGHRHLLPTFPPMFVLCGAAGAWMYASRKWLRPVVPVLLAALAVVSLRIWPHYLAFFNTVAGGPANGYRHLVDSSLDWGQDLPVLARWLDANRGRGRAYAAYFGTGDWKHYGVKALPMPYYLRSDGTGTYVLEPGAYCVSATRLQLVYLIPTCEWTNDMEAEYRQLKPEMDAFAAVPNTREARAAALEQKDGGFRSRFNRFARLRFARLCAYLRERRPDDHVNYSILVHRLNEEDLVAALEGPLP
ncbi:MAG: glycosyltransferase family 39 protein [Phycisphaerales bacterium]|nr:MAG: glycosyltransferase family 39 protein [Phycisphaerales bacterium]